MKLRIAVITKSISCYSIWNLKRYDLLEGDIVLLDYQGRIDDSMYGLIVLDCNLRSLAISPVDYIVVGVIDPNIVDENAVKLYCEHWDTDFTLTSLYLKEYATRSSGHTGYIKFLDTNKFIPRSKNETE
jgi:hypothetical protein